MRSAITLLGMFLGCCATVANDAMQDLSEHLGKTPALVVVVCQGNDADVTTIAQLVEQTPWTIFCRGAASPGMDKIRDWAREKALLGERVYVADDGGPSLWLAGDMADAVWVAPVLTTRVPATRRPRARSCACCTPAASALPQTVSP